MSKSIPWVVFPHAPEARLASKMNVVIVEADTPQEARRLASGLNPYGEEYNIGFSVVSLAAVLHRLGGAMVIVGNMATTPDFTNEPFAFT